MISLLFSIFFMIMTNDLSIGVQNAEIVVKVTNIKNDEGVIRVLLFKEACGFPDSPEKAFHSASVIINNQIATVSFKQLPAGKYAISVFHDSQNTGKLRTNMMGIPKDGYGFSNNARSTFSAPSFESAAFDLEETGKRISIELTK